MDRGHCVGLLLDTSCAYFYIIGTQCLEIANTRGSCPNVYISIYLGEGGYAYDNLLTSAASNIPFGDEDISEFRLGCQSLFHKSTDSLHSKCSSWTILQSSLNEPHIHFVLNASTVSKSGEDRSRSA